METKDEARARLQSARAALPREQHERAAPALLEHLRPLVLSAQRVASYASVGAEPSTEAVNALRDDVLLPVLLPDGDLDWATGPLAPGPHGLLEPTGPRLGPDAVRGCDLVLVPALAVDRGGVRLGRGAGSYDRALRRATGRTVALLHDGELLEQLPVEPHDVPVAAAVTPGDAVVELGRTAGARPAFDDVLAANEAYAAQLQAADLAARAARGLAVVTCMDSRIDPLAMLGLQLGDAKVLRTAGGRVTDEVLRSLVLAHHLLGVERVLVVAHTDCGAVKDSDDVVHRLIAERSGVDTRSVDFRTIADPQGTLAGDVQRVRSSPYLPEGLPVLGCVYDVRTGRLDCPVS